MQRAERVYVHLARVRLRSGDPWPAIASRELYRSIGTGVDGGQLILGREKIIAKTQLHASAPHAGYVERGIGPLGDGTYTAPDGVPISAILEWMAAKPTFVPFGHPVDVAATIIENIEERGIKPHPFFEPAVDAAQQQLTSDLRQSVRSVF